MWNSYILKELHVLNHIYKCFVSLRRSRTWRFGKKKPKKKYGARWKKNKWKWWLLPRSSATPNVVSPRILNTRTVTVTLTVKVNVTYVMCLNFNGYCKSGWSDQEYLLWRTFLQQSKSTGNNARFFKGRVLRAWRLF